MSVAPSAKLSPYPSGAVFHSWNPRVVWVNVFAARVMSVPPLPDWESIDPEPPLASKLTVTVAVSHCAYSVVGSVNVTRLSGG